MDLSPGLRIFRRYGMAIIAIGILASIIAYSASYAFSPSYSAMSRVLIRGREGRVLSTTGKNLESQLSADSGWAKPLIQTMTSLVTSREVAENVVRELKLDQPKPPPTTVLAAVRQVVRDSYYVALAYVKYGYYAVPPAFDGAVDELQKSLVVTNIRESYIVEIKARADNPEQARAIADSVANNFIQISRAQFRSSSTAYQQFLTDEVESARARIADAEADVRALKERESIGGDVAEQIRLAGNAQDAAERSLSDAKVALAEVQAKEASLQARLEDMSPTEETRMTTRTESSNGGVVGRLEQDQVGESPNRVRQDVERMLINATSEREAIEQRVAENTVVLSDRRQRVRALVGTSTALADLQLKVVAAQDAFREATQAQSKALLSGGNDAGDVTLVDRATAPLYPDRPIRYVYALVGLLGGIVGGTGIALLLDLRPNTLRVPGFRSRGGRSAGQPVPPPTLSPQPSAFRTSDGTAPEPASE